MPQPGRTRQLPLPKPHRYRAILAVPGTAAFFVPAALARLGVAMTSLAIFWAVRAATDSFAAAGAATAAFAIAEATVGPQVARLVDRYGQRRVVGRTLVVFALAGTGIILGCARSAGSGVLVPLAALAGAAVPQVGALSASRWRRVLQRADQRAAALSLEAAVNDVAFLLGPILVTTLGAATVAYAGLGLAGGLVVIGLIVLLAQHGTEPATGPPPPGAGRRRLLNPTFAALIAVNVGIGLFFGAASLDVTAFALAHRAGGATGAILAASSLTSLTAGLVYGARGAKIGPRAVLLGAALVLTVGCAGLAAVPDLIVMFPAYAVVGGCVALILIPAAVLLQRSTAVAVYTQAMTWMNSASALGIAIAAPVTGLVIEAAGWRAGFLLTAALVTVLPLSIAVGWRALRS